MLTPDRSRTHLERLRAGGLVLVVDSALDPPDAAVVCAASRVAPAAVNFMAMHARGLVCLAMPRERMRQLGFEYYAIGRGTIK